MEVVQTILQSHEQCGFSCSSAFDCIVPYVSITVKLTTAAQPKNRFRAAHVLRLRLG